MDSVAGTMASTSDLSLVSVEARRKEEEVQVVDEGDVVFVSENAASKTARRSRAIVSGTERGKRTGRVVTRPAMTTNRKGIPPPPPTPSATLCLDGS